MPFQRSSSSLILRTCGVLLLMLGLSRQGIAQSFPFTSGPIPLCSTSTFTAEVSGIGTLYPPWMEWSFSLQMLEINITTDHPQTLQILLTSPEGTTLLLSEYNGAGGENYTGTQFIYDGWQNITTGTAPFTGMWAPQGGSLSAFDYEQADGTWTITVIDTACAGGGSGPGGVWTPGWFDGGASGGFGFAFNEPPPCWGGIPNGMAYTCAGAPVDLLDFYQTSSSGYDYYFMMPDGWTQVPDPSAVTEPGFYQVSAFDIWTGCSYWAQFEVIAQPAAALGADQVVAQCSSAGAVDLTALFPPGGYTPIWTLDGAPITVAEASAATAPGVYELIGETNSSCNDTAQVVLTFTAGPTIGADQVLNICAGTGADLTTLYTTTGYAAEWSFGGTPFTTPTAATAAGVYTLEVAANGCTDQAEVTLNVQPMAGLGPDEAIDLCTNSSLDLTALYTTTGLTTAWTVLGAPISDPTSVSAGGTYRLVASAGASCTDTAFVVVTSLVPPSLGMDMIGTTCAGEGEELTSLFVLTGLSTTWTVDGAPVPDPAAATVPGLYMLIAQNASGCQDTAHVLLNVVTGPVLADQAAATCAGTPMDLTALYSTGSDATAWTIGGAPVADPAAVTAAGTYTLTVTNASGCSGTAEVVLAVNEAPVLDADRTVTICTGAVLDLNGLYDTDGLPPLWTIGGATVPDPGVVAEAGIYRLVVINAAGCSDTAVVELVVSPGPSLGDDLSFTLCPWQTVDLSTVFPVLDMTASYASDGQALADPTAVSAPGTYTVTVTDANGCTDEAQASVTAMACLCEADFTEDAHCIQDPTKFTLLADSAIVAASWDMNGVLSTEIDPVVRFSAEEDVLVTLRATLSCGVVTVERTISVQDCSDSCSVWIPSAFTPDNDTKNDTWTWNGECRPEDFHMEIYDRLGEVIFKTNDPERPWDGTCKGVMSPSGMYAYRVGYRLPYQERKEVVGSIALLR